MTNICSSFVSYFAHYRTHYFARYSRSTSSHRMKNYKNMAAISYFTTGTTELFHQISEKKDLNSLFRDLYLERLVLGYKDENSLAGGPGK